MIARLLKFAKSETGLYLIFGALTTLVNYIVFGIFLSLLGDDRVLTVNTVSFVAAVIFAYVTNKLFVFGSKSWEPKILLKEIPSFLSARVFSYLFEQVGLYLSTDILHLESYSILSVDGVMVAKLLLSIGVIIINWVISKFFIFKKN